MTNKERKVIEGVAGWLYADHDIYLDAYYNYQTEKIDWDGLLKELRLKDESTSEALAEMLEHEGIYS
jgi:hypothetical protein